MTGSASSVPLDMAMLHERSARTDAMWSDYRAASGATGGYEVVAFGDTLAMADELAALVTHGPKRATAGLLRDFDDDPLPVIGDHVVLVDGSAMPRAVWRTTDIRVSPLASVTEAFAWDEGEGERTREDWLRGHRAFFARQAASEGFDMHDGIETVFERFTVVWPPELADDA